jgi:hypothetical protein
MPSYSAKPIFCCMQRARHLYNLTLLEAEAVECQLVILVTVQIERDSS